MKGLEQAVNMKLLAGSREPAKAWGKLKRISVLHRSRPLLESRCQRSRGCQLREVKNRLVPRM